jgi:tetratricopeptide (TPR) repeat protein
LINEQNQIEKIYQGRVAASVVKEDLQRIPQTNAERLQRALPFPGVSDTFEYARNYLSLGSVYFQHGYLDEAEAVFLLARREDGASAEATYGLGSVYLKQGNLERARESFEQTITSKASYPDTIPKTWNNLGLIAARSGRTEEAVGYFQRALRLSPDYLTALENLGNAYRQAHQWEQAQHALEQALTLKPDRAELHYSLAMIFAQTDQRARAEASLQKAISLRPDYPEALNNLGVLYARTRRLDEAIAEFQACMRVAPGFDQAYLNLARVYALQGQSQKARSVLSQLLNQQPDNAQAREALSELH